MEIINQTLVNGRLHCVEAVVWWKTTVQQGGVIEGEIYTSVPELGGPVPPTVHTLSNLEKNKPEVCHISISRI